jgi:glycosyltransferase involved in cell wall biosynthesis
VEALAALKARGKKILVLASGQPNDHRQPEHYSSLVARVETLGIGDMLKLLGLVPYIDLMSLMRESVAVMNPSLFEGWSTTVEEAKSMGKTVLLSDIDTHREQAPEHGLYFDPHDAQSLSELLWSVTESWDETTDRRKMEQASLALLARRREFSQRYESIVVRLNSRG